MRENGPGDRRALLLAFAAAAGLCAPMSADAATRVLVIHGFAANKIFLEGIARHLRDDGFDARTWGYPSITEDMPRIVQRLRREVARLSPGDTVDFVTHSMGGIVVRSYLQSTVADSTLPYVHRIVMIAPPNRGAEIADFFIGIAVVRWMMGPNLSKMRTDSASYVNKLPPLNGREVGIIAGVKFSPRKHPVPFDTTGDGFVSVPRTKLGTEQDFATVDEGHSFIIHKKETHAYVLRFLREGRFAETPPPGTDADSLR